MLFLWITLACTFLPHQGLIMASKVIRRGESIVLTCDGTNFNNFDSLKSSPTGSPTTSKPPKFSWFIKPFGKPRTLLASCTDIYPLFEEIFEIVVRNEGHEECLLKSINASLIPAGTYECCKIDTAQQTFVSELVVMEEEPICRLVSKEDGKEAVIYSNSDSISNSSSDNTKSVFNGSTVEVQCSSIYSGNLVHKFHVSLIGIITEATHNNNNNNNNNKTFGFSFLSSVNFKVNFDDSQMVRFSLSASFHPQDVNTRDDRALSEALVYQIQFPLVLVPSKGRHLNPSSQTTVLKGEVIGGSSLGPNDPKKWAMDETAMVVVGILIVTLLFLVLVFSFCYFQMVKRIRDIQTASAPVSGESVPYHLREINSLYDEINADEEIPEFMLNPNAYTELNQRSLLRKIPNDEVDSKLSSSSSKRSTYVQPVEMSSNIYLDLVSSQTKTSFSKKVGTLCEKDEDLKVNNGLYLLIPTTTEVDGKSLSTDITYLHVVSDDKVSNSSSAYENTCSLCP